MNEPAIKVLIVDDHTMVAEGISAVLSAEIDLKVMGIAGTVAESLELAERYLPDVVIMDFQLPDGDGGDATKGILARWPKTAVIMLTGMGASDALAKAIDAGCSGFLIKGLQVRELDEAVRAVHRGEIVIRAGALDASLASLKAPTPTLTSHDLTAREIEILSKLSTGSSTEEMAEEFFLSLHTVRNHIRNIMAKLGARSRLQAVVIATHDGIIPAA